MARPHDLLRWLSEAGYIDPAIELHPTTGFRSRTFHVNGNCRRHRTPEGVVTARVSELDALFGPGDSLCLGCAPDILGERHPEAANAFHSTLRRLALLTELDDTTRIPYAHLLPALMAERSHQVLERIRRSITQESHDLDGSGTPDAVLRDRLGETIDNMTAGTPRPDREQVMTEALRLAAVLNASRQIGYPRREITEAAVAGEEPSEIIAEALDDQERSKVTAFIDEIERRIVEATPVFALLQCYPDVLYHPLNSLLEVAVVASARYFGHHRAIGELPEEICDTFPRRRHKDDRGPYPEQIDVTWEPVGDDVLETAVQLWKISDIDEPWSNLNGALDTAIALR